MAKVITIMSDDFIKQQIVGMKLKLDFDTTEDMFDIMPPHDLQCGNIGNIVKSIKSIEKESELRRFSDEDQEALLEKINDINYEVSGLDDKVEEIREAIELVREWGKEWKQFALKLVVLHKMKETEYLDDLLRIDEMID